MTTSWGKPSYTKATKQFIAVKENSSLVFRILPPMKSLAAKGSWCVYHRQHFGYYTVDGEDPTRKSHKPFYCVEKYDFKAKKVVEHCPECDKIKEVKDRVDAVREKMKKEGQPEETIQKACEALGKWSFEHNLDPKYYINIKTQDGKFGTFKLGSRAKKQLDIHIEKLLKAKRSIDPVAPEEGVWWEITRTGKGKKTEYALDVVRESVERDGETFDRVKSAPLTADDFDKAQLECYDLSDVGIRMLSVDRISALVKSNGDPDIVRTIFGVPERVQETSVEDPPTENAQTTDEPVVAKKEPALIEEKPKPVAATKAPAPPKVSAPAKPAVEPSYDDIDGLSDDEFNAVFLGK